MLCIGQTARAADPAYAACGTNQGTTSAAVTCSPGAGEALVAWVMTTAATTVAISGFTSCGTSQSTTNHGELVCFYTCNVAGGSQTITVTGGVSVTYLLVNRVQNALATNSTACLDQYGKTSGTGANITVPTAGSVSQTNEMLLLGITDWDTNKTITAGTGATIREKIQDATNGDAVASETGNTVTGLSGVQTLGFTITTGDTKNIAIVTIKGVSGTAYTRSAAESMWPVEVAVRVYSAVRAPSESGPSAEAGSRLVSYGRASADSEPPSESGSRVYGAIRTPSDSAPPSESSARLVSYGRASADSEPPSELGSRLVSYARSSADSGPPSESGLRLVSYGRASADFGPPSELGSRLVSYGRASADSGPPSESGVRLVSYGRANADSGGVSDLGSRALALFRNAAEVGPPSESGNRLAGYLRSDANSGGVSDVGSRIANAVRNYDEAGNETLTISDAPSRLVSYGRSTSDLALPLDFGSRGLSFFRSNQDAITLADYFLQTITPAPLGRAPSEGAGRAPVQGSGTAPAEGSGAVPGEGRGNAPQQGTGAAPR